MSENADNYFRRQQRQEDLVTLNAMIIQISINLGIALVVLILFSWLRPRHTFLYAPKEKLSKSDVRRPTALGSGWFDWIKPVFKIKDDALLENIGLDAYIFIYFTRILRRLVIVLTLISMFIFLPINIVATYNTGDWPPVGLEFLSISAMNYQHGKASKYSNHLWYWAPTAGTYVFSLIITIQMISASKRFVLFRQRYSIQREESIKQRLPCMSPTELLQHEKQELISRTLLVHFDANNKPKSITKQNYIIPNNKSKTLVNSCSTNTPCQQVLVGKHNTKVASMIKEYNSIIQLLERYLQGYLTQLKNKADGSTASIKRPLVRMNWKSKRVDAINYYTERALVLEANIRRNRSKLNVNNYGWVTFATKAEAHEAYLSIQKKMKPRQKSTLPIERIRLAPHPDDIVWTNMNIDSHTGQLKRWFGYGLFISIVFVWCIPVAILAVISNMINLIRMFPKSEIIIDSNQLIMGLIQSYFTPCLMVLFFFGLPRLLRFVSRQQAYKTETVIQQKILSKLYAFFVFNNLFIFTLVSMMVGIVGQINALTLVGSLKSKSISQYIVQIAKNMTDVSSFWISYVCIRSVGVLFELLQCAPLLWIVILHGKGRFNYTPRQLEQVTSAPPYFDFAKNYGLVISFFTAALVYSVQAPIVLPFALIYFSLATTTYKYRLMYVNVTKVETHGMIWPMLYCIVMISVFVFQTMMILVLSLKAGMYQIFALIPLPFITTAVLVIYTRRLLKQNTLKTWIELNNSIRLSRRNSGGSSGNDVEMTETIHHNRTTSDEDPLLKDERLMNSIYKDPVLSSPLWKPMIFDHLKPYIPLVYQNHPKCERILSTFYSEEASPIEQDQSQQPKETTVQMEPTMESPVESEKERLKAEMQLYPPTPDSHPSSYHYYYDDRNGGSSSQQHLMYTEPFIENDTSVIATAPPLDMFTFQPSEETHIQHQLPPPPNYADIVSPRINDIVHSEPQQTSRPPMRRHSIS